MRLVRSGILVVGFVAVAALPVRADLSARCNLDCAALNPGVTVVVSAVSAAMTGQAQRAFAESGVIDPVAEPLIPAETAGGVVPAAARAEQNVRELPPLPDSASLFLSAILSVGAWQLVRSAKQFDLAAAPEWYHVEGPTQIGHATAFDLDMNASALCRFEQPETDSPYRSLLPEHTLRLDAQHALAVAVPRGPPVSW